MRKIESKIIALPSVYFVTSDAEMNELPFGIPFIRGLKHEYKEVVRILEFEYLYKSMLRLGLPFQWSQLLRDHGIKEVKIDKATSDSSHGDGGSIRDKDNFTVEDYIKDTSYVVDIEMLKNLNLLPEFYLTVEENVKSNIHTSMIFNPSLYNKKLGLPVGDVEIVGMDRNLLIIDASSSIPVSIAISNITLAKTMSQRFNADVLLTGAISVLYDYDDVSEMDVKVEYARIGRNNEQAYFMELLSTPRKYGTIISFGDDHSPTQSWGSGRTYTIAQGKEACKWECNKLISGHVDSNTRLSGYSVFFEPNEIEYLKDWTKYLN